MAQMDAVVAPYGDIVALHPSHAFVPSVSAIAYAGAPLFHDIAGDADLLDHVPFEDVFVPATNEEHVTVSPDGAAWLRARLTEDVVSAPPATAAASVALGRPEPNPTTAGTRIAFSLPDARSVRLEIVGVDGRSIRTLEAGVPGPGRHTRVWDGRDSGGAQAPPGLYLAVLTAGPERHAARFVRIR
jgi:hypothetical protein